MGYVLIGIIVVLLLAFLLIYNNLVKLNIRCENGIAGIDNQLKRRIDLIPNLVEVTKGYAKHEVETLVAVVNARNANATLSQKAKETEEISKNINSILALSENYPELKANELFKNLQIELVGTEDKIAFARQFYNDTVQKYNSAIQVFPNNLIANMFNFKEREYFQISDADRENVKIEL